MNTEMYQELKRKGIKLYDGWCFELWFMGDTMYLLDYDTPNTVYTMEREQYLSFMRGEAHLEFDRQW